MTLRQCCEVLGLKEGADLAEIKRAYRRLAFALHPDLNPDIPDAARKFQEANEAYVQLSQAHARARAERAAGAFGEGTFHDSGRRKDEARKAYSKAGGQNFDSGAAAGETNASASGKPGSGAGGRAAPGRSREEDVLKDILNDPFARRVFEDIYSHIREGGQSPQSSSGNETAGNGPGGAKRTGREKPNRPGMLDKVRGWFRKQIDDEQVVRLPKQSLTPGARVRLEIQHGFAEKPQIVEITLPPEFVPGKAMRLKGMGRRIGNLRGDLYVRIEPAPG
ncbi:MAG: DnaJ domain-containing protein [Desulfovibrio sp.]|jgi:molecular chaperone DnaJ|nr:DnaJ domain-containing protein [Desulfovibrio sp.]